MIEFWAITNTFHHTIESEAVHRIAPNLTEFNIQQKGLSFCSAQHQGFGTYYLVCTQHVLKYLEIVSRKCMFDEVEQNSKLLLYYAKIHEYTSNHRYGISVRLVPK